MKMRKSAGLLTAGFLAGMLVGTPAVHAAAEYIAATRSTQPVYVDGQKVSMEAYAINGHNYVQLRDVGQAVGFNVYWDGSAVQVDTGSPYTGEAPARAKPTQAVQPVSAIPERPINALPAQDTGSRAAPTSQDVETLRQEIIDRTNAVRVQNGLPALPADPMLMKAAQVRAEEMAATTTYSHTRPDGSDRKSVTDCPYASENIHRIWDIFLEQQGLGLAEFCVNSWASSEGHRQNMLQNNRRAIGVGLARGVNELGQPCWYCVQWFLRDGYAITWVDTPKIP